MAADGGLQPGEGDRLCKHDAEFQDSAGLGNGLHDRGRGWSDLGLRQARATRSCQSTHRALKADVPDWEPYVHSFWRVHGSI